MRKKDIRTVAFTLLFAMMLSVSVFAEDATVTGSDVNLRSGPGTDYSVLDCLPKDAVVTVNDRSNSEWYSVSYNGQSGFMYASYLAVSGGQAAPQQSNGGTSGSISAMYVRFRSGPSTDYSILGEYNRGTALTITGSENGWYAVVINGQSGYVYGDYVTTETAEAAPAETPAPTPEPTPAPAQADTTGGTAGHIVGDYVNFRSGASTSNAILGSYNNGYGLTIMGDEGDWKRVVIDGTAGYVYASYVAADGQPQVEAAAPTVAETSSTDGYITGNNVRFRSGASTSSDILGEYSYGAKLTITGTSGDWKAVVINGQAGYVYGQYVAEGSITVPADSGSSSDLGNQVVEYALQYVGYPYVWGGSSPNGFDCSGFTSYVFKHFGITLNRVANDQARNGVEVPADQLQPGDVLCFYSGSDYIGHVGIYIGDGKFVHASTSTTGVIISELGGYYTNRQFVARRMV